MPIQDMGDGVSLMGPKLNFRVHAHKMDVAAIVFAGADGVVQLVVFFDQRFPAQSVLENPVFESVLNGTLFGLCRLGFGKIGYTLFIAVFVPHNVEDFGGSQIQGVFQKMISIDPLGAVGRCDLDVAVAITFLATLSISRTIAPRN